MQPGGLHVWTAAFLRAAMRLPDPLRAGSAFPTIVVPPEQSLSHRHTQKQRSVGGEATNDARRHTAEKPSDPALSDDLSPGLEHSIWDTKRCLLTRFDYVDREYSCPGSAPRDPATHERHRSRQVGAARGHQVGEAERTEALVGTKEHHVERNIAAPERHNATEEAGDTVSAPSTPCLASARPPPFARLRWSRSACRTLASR